MHYREQKATETGQIRNVQRFLKKKGKQDRRSRCMPHTEKNLLRVLTEKDRTRLYCSDVLEEHLELCNPISWYDEKGYLCILCVKSKSR